MPALQLKKQILSILLFSEYCILSVLVHWVSKKKISIILLNFNCKYGVDCCNWFVEFSVMFLSLYKVPMAPNNVVSTGLYNMLKIARLFSHYGFRSSYQWYYYHSYFCKYIWTKQRQGFILKNVLNNEHSIT